MYADCNPCGQTKKCWRVFFVFASLYLKESFSQHLLSSVGIGHNGRVSRLFTLTAVCPEDQFSTMGETLRQIVDTFDVPPPLY